jgi:hypothetical protein
MTSSANIRRERIERLLRELEYEVTRGMLEREIDEEIGFRFYVPVSQKIPDGMVFCEFRSRPLPRHAIMHGEPQQPRLKLVGEPS